MNLPDRRGPADLEVVCFLLWDDQCLYFSARVSDDKHVPVMRSSSSWTGDGFRLAFDPNDNSLNEPRYGPDDIELGFAADNAGHSVAQTLEAQVGWMIGWTSGRFAGHKHGGKYHDWSYLYNYYRQQLWRWNSPIGWAHLAWYVAAKPREHWHETADLLRAGVIGHDITRWQPDRDLFQMEIRGPDGTWWVLLNDGPARELAIAPKRPMAPGKYRRFVWVDGPVGLRRIVEEPNQVDAREGAPIDLGQVPEKGIVTVGWLPLAEWEKTQRVLSEAARVLEGAPGDSDTLCSRLEGARFVAELGFLTRARKLATRLADEVRSGGH